MKKIGDWNIRPIPRLTEFILEQVFCFPFQDFVHQTIYPYWNAAGSGFYLEEKNISEKKNIVKF